MVNDYVLENKEVIDIHLTNSLIRIQSNLLRYADLLEQKNQTVVDPQIDRVFFYNLGTVYQSYITSVSVKM
jgi:hypothetical protein